MALNIIFMGTPDFAVPTLQSIFKSKHKILTVYTQPPKKKFRGQKILHSPVHSAAKDLNIPIRSPENLKTDNEFENFKSLKPNLVVVVAYGKIIPKKYLDLEGIHFINIHASILPRWRGAAPIQRAIMNMDKETGISIMKINENLDTGPIMKIKKIKIESDTNYGILYKKMSSLSSSTITECLEQIENQTERFISQDHSKATYAKKIEKSESRINWNEDAKIIIAKINAFYPTPGCWFNLNGSRIKVKKAIFSNINGKPGEILDHNFSIACATNSIRIIELKKEGKKEMDVKDFVKGNKLKIGTILDGA